MKQFGQSFVEDKFDLENAIQTKAELSYAIAVMDRVGGWEEEDGEQENWVGPRFAASMWIYTKAVMCNVQNHMQNFRIFKLSSIKEAVNGMCDDAFDEHVWVSEGTISLHKTKVLEVLQYDIEIPCIVQWRMLWLSTPTSLNNEPVNDGAILEQYFEAVNLASQSVFWRMNTPRSLYFLCKYVQFWTACLRASGTWKGKWWVGDWVKGVTCCVTGVTVTTTWILKMNENVWCLGKWVMQICSKSKDESVFCRRRHLLLPSSSRSRVQRKLTILKKGNDTEKLWMVFKRMANKIRMAPFSCVRGRPKLAGSLETTKFSWKVEGSFQRRWRAGVVAKGQEKHLVKELPRKPEKRTRSPCFARSIKSSWKGG